MCFLKTWGKNTELVPIVIVTVDCYTGYTDISRLI